MLITMNRVSRNLILNPSLKLDLKFSLNLSLKLDWKLSLKLNLNLGLNLSLNLIWVWVWNWIWNWNWIWTSVEKSVGRKGHPSFVLKRNFFRFSYSVLNWKANFKSEFRFPINIEKWILSLFFFRDFVFARVLIWLVRSPK